MMEIETLEKGLTPKERRFAQEYLKDFVGAQAAIRAGYSAGKNNASAATTASRLLRDEHVKAYLDALLREHAEGACASKESIVSRLLTISSRCMQAEPVMEWDSGRHDYVETGEYQFDSRGATKALEQLCKILGYDAPVKLAADGGVSIEVNGKAAEYAK
ncbi:MAG: terminase small subunit [Oscillospiraceae bacterium]|nr:terminase small subunit [Oscillospiraceae bacterium]